MFKTRYLQPLIEELCFPMHKMAFISGPRQCGKTTLAKQLLKQRKLGKYLNWDEKTFRRAWTKDPKHAISFNEADTKPPIIVLDEIHKAKLWKRDLKGIYDTLEEEMDIIVTGSAKLNVYRRGSDSLLGRYFHFRLHPFSLAELLTHTKTISHQQLIDTLFQKNFKSSKKVSDWFNRLYQYGPFPEPLISSNTRIHKLWQNGRTERLIREDLRDLSRIQELSQIEMLVSLLPERASGVLSINSLREDLEVAYPTMKLWISYLQQLYYLFAIKPYSKSIPRSLKKEGKLYLWDWSEIETDGEKFENMIACHLLKYANFLTDAGLADVKLHYLKNKQKQEIDFLLVKDNQPWLPIEVKLTDELPSKNWYFYLKNLPCKRGLQVVKTPGICKHVILPEGELLIISAEYFLPCLV